MATFEQSIVIDRPRDEVYAYLADIENEVEWQEGLISVKASERPLAVGSTGEDTRKSMGMKSVTKWQVLELDPGVGFVFKVTKPLPFTGAFSLEDVGDQTRVTMTAEPEGFTKLLWPMIAGMGRKQYAKDFATLKQVLEARPAG